MQNISVTHKKKRISKLLLLCVFCLSMAMVSACSSKKTIEVPQDGTLDTYDDGYYQDSKPPSNTSIHYPNGAPTGERERPYTVLGQTYHPLKSAHGFVEEGVASWYGPDFHGKKTANGERYDMHGMTAAHRILPFGTQLKVTNLSNGKVIYVRVNDRGPFVNNRIIDLTKSGAKALGMLGAGTARVRIEAIGTTPEKRRQHHTEKPSTHYTGNYYVQIGAFSNQESARNLAHRMQKAGHKSRYFFANSVGLWRVQVGPWANANDAERAQWRLQGDFPDATIVGD